MDSSGHMASLFLCKKCHGDSLTQTIAKPAALQATYTVTVTLFNTIVLRGVMQCYRLVGKGEFSASIGTYTIIITITMRIIRYNIKMQKKARQRRTFNSHARCFSFNSLPTPEHVCYPLYSISYAH